jgi:two-component system, chemotaxis family, sensor histidine kinase and response regulator WspE
VRITSEQGQGTRFCLQLPLTLSVIRTLLVEIAGEVYAFPLARIARAVKTSRQKIEVLEGRQHFNFEGQQIGIVTAHQVLGTGQPESASDELAVVVVGEQDERYGLVVDRFIGGRELVVQALDPRLGKVKDISAAALLDDGTPALIIDVEDMVRSMEKLAHADRLEKVQHDREDAPERRRKRVLVVDDSLTVRELQRKLLDHYGYDIEVAVDGMDGWNAVRGGRFDLVITDIDMPRMDGIELVGLIKRDPKLRSLPVMILSYKDRDEDRRRGLEAGADYYLTKGSFHDDTLLQSVVDLIGEAAA